MHRLYRRDDRFAVVDHLARNGDVLSERRRQRAARGITSRATTSAWRMGPDRRWMLTYISWVPKLVSVDVHEMQTGAVAAATFLKAIANDCRLMILCELLKGERSVGEMAPWWG